MSTAYCISQFRVQHFALVGMFFRTRHVFTGTCSTETGGTTGALAFRAMSSANSKRTAVHICKGCDEPIYVPVDHKKDSGPIVAIASGFMHWACRTRQHGQIMVSEAERQAGIHKRRVETGKRLAAERQAQSLPAADITGSDEEGWWTAKAPAGYQWQPAGMHSLVEATSLEITGAMAVNHLESCPGDCSCRKEK